MSERKKEGCFNTQETARRVAKDVEWESQQRARPYHRLATVERHGRWYCVFSWRKPL